MVGQQVRQRAKIDPAGLRRQRRDHQFRAGNTLPVKRRMLTDPIFAEPNLVCMDPLADRPVKYLFCSALRPEKRRLEHANFHNGYPASKSDEKLGASALLTVHHVNETNHGHPPWLSPISCDPAKLRVDAGHAS